MVGQCDTRARSGDHDGEYYLFVNGVEANPRCCPPERVETDAGVPRPGIGDGPVGTELHHHGILIAVVCDGQRHCDSAAVADGVREAFRQCVGNSRSARLVFVEKRPDVVCDIDLDVECRPPQRKDAFYPVSGGQSLLLNAGQEIALDAGDGLRNDGGRIDRAHFAAEFWTAARTATPV